MIVIKLGGNALAASFDSDWIDALLSAFDKEKRMVLVHGGGPQIDAELAAHQIPKVVVDGFRVTNDEAFSIVEMVLAGQVQQTLVRGLKSRGLPAVGITGSDGGLFDVVRKSSPTGQDLGRVGEVVKVDTKIIETLWQGGFLPVLSPVSSNAKGEGFNVNADLAAGALAGALKVEQAIFMTDVKGIYRNYPDEDSIIEKASLDELRLMSASFSSGMLPKVEAVTHALINGAERAHVIDGRDGQALMKLLSGAKVGSEIFNA